MTAYKLILTDQGEAIECLICGTTSATPYDVTELHCPKCHRYHQQAWDIGARLFAEAVSWLRPDLSEPQQMEMVGCLLDHCDPQAHPRVEPQPQWSDAFSGPAM